MRILTVAGFIALGLVALALYIAGRTERSGIAPLGDLVDAVRASALGRWALVVVWAWAGWHLLAR